LDHNAVPALLTLDRRWETRPSPVSIQRSERLVTNLLALVETPPSIYVAPTWLTDARQLGPELRKRGYHRSDWLLRDRTIFSFTDPKSSALGSFVEGGIETIDAEEWSESKDTETTNRFVDLLRQTLREQEHQSLAVHGKQRYFYFRATRDLSDRRVATNSKSKGRTVFTGYENKRKPARLPSTGTTPLASPSSRPTKAGQLNSPPPTTTRSTATGSFRGQPIGSQESSSASATRQSPHLCGFGPDTSAGRALSAKRRGRSPSVNYMSSMWIAASTNRRGVHSAPRQEPMTPGSWSSSDAGTNPRRA
jgi:hypothetical protein